MCCIIVNGGYCAPAMGCYSTFSVQPPLLSPWEFHGPLVCSVASDILIYNLIFVKKNVSPLVLMQPHSVVEGGTCIPSHGANHVPSSISPVADVDKMQLFQNTRWVIASCLSKADVYGFKSYVLHLCDLNLPYCTLLRAQNRRVKMQQLHTCACIG